MIFIGSDHGGYSLKLEVIEHLKNRGIEVTDIGCDSEASCDYPVYAKKVTDAIKDGSADLGILICGTGIGISIAANKVKGIRAAVVTNEFCAEMTRRHNDANILAMGGRVISPETAVKLTDIFLNTEFEGGRHERRIEQIAKIENGEDF